MVSWLNTFELKEWMSNCTSFFYVDMIIYDSPNPGAGLANQF